MKRGFAFKASPLRKDCRVGGRSPCSTSPGMQEQEQEEEQEEKKEEAEEEEEEKEETE